MNIRFWKMHGAGNDFILCDDREQTFPLTDTAWIEQICSRRTGVGCEGLILIQPSEKADFRMRFFNPDGSEVEMCGNGARCVARLAHEIGAAPEEMTIDTVAGILGAQALGENVQLEMTTPSDWQMEQELEIDGETIAYSSVNSGVPHAVVQADNLEEYDIQNMGSSMRYHNAFAPAGTNANFIAVTGPQSLSVRTYERGVEAETLACGTGIVASALIATRLGMVTSPVTVTARSGDILSVGCELTDAGAENVTLLGPAAHVFEGTLEYQQ